MDYPTAVAIFVPVSTLVVTIGAIFLKKTNKKKNVSYPCGKSVGIQLISSCFPHSGFPAGNTSPE